MIYMMHPTTIEAGEKYESVFQSVSQYFMVERRHSSQRNLEREDELKRSINNLHNYYVSLIRRLPNENIPREERNNLVFNIFGNNNHVMQRWASSLGFEIDRIESP